MRKAIRLICFALIIAAAAAVFAGCQNKESVGSSAVITESGEINNESLNQSLESAFPNNDAPYIGKNGNWWINGADTGLSVNPEATQSQFQTSNSSDKNSVSTSSLAASSNDEINSLSEKNGSTPTQAPKYYIGRNGNWWINGVDTGLKAVVDNNTSTSSNKNNSSSKKTETSSKKESTSSKKTQTSSKKSENSKTESVTTSSIASKPISDNGVNKTGWPIVNQKITIEYMGVEGTGYADTNNMSSFKYYESKTNIHFDFIGVPENQIESRKALVIQSNDLPDIFGFYSGSFTDYEIYRYGKEGVFVDIAPYIDEYAPNISQLLKGTNTYAANADKEGHVYTVPLACAESNSVNDLSTHKYWLNINKAWLLNLDKAVPTTPSEFLSVLRAFRDEDPNGNGKDDEIPYAEWNWDANWITAPWGVYAGDGNIGVDNSGRVYYSLATEEAHQATMFWNTIRNENGLMYSFFTDNSANNLAAFKAQIANGKVGCFRWSDLDSVNFSPNLLKQYVAIPYLSANFNSLQFDLPKSCQPFNKKITRSPVIITKNCKNIEAALRYYDFLTTDDGIMLMNFGAEESGLYKKLADGSYKLTINNLADRYKHGLGWRIGIQEWPVAKIDRDSLSGDAYYEYAAKAERVYGEAHKKSPTTYLADVFKTAEELAQIEKFDYFSNSSSGAMAAYLSDYQNGTLNNWESNIQDYKNKGLANYLKLWQGIVDVNKQHLYNSF